MDMIENLAKQASQITMYDIKSYYNSAKNTILNVPEMEAKVREATNDDAWGASSTLMQQISEGISGCHQYLTTQTLFAWIKDGTSLTNSNEFNIIMPCIYSRFMEKEAREWRQIYKALTLLEFLVKNGSERVVDDARAHISTIKMLRSFHYIDEKGKDQGINVRNRASEIATLLGDVEQIRRERRKAKANRSKYQGHEGGGGGMSFMTAGGSRYGGFGSDSINSGGGGGGGSGGGYEGGDDYRRRDYNSSSRNQGGGGAAEYDEYEGADDFDDRAVRRTGSTSTGNSRPGSRPQVPSKNADAPPPKAKAPEKKPEVNLFDFDDDPIPVAAPAPAQAAPILGGDDDFDDFQTAPTPTASAPAPASATRPQANNAGLFDLLNTGSAPAQPTAPSFSSPVRASNGMQAPLSAAPAASRPNYTSSPSTTSGKPMMSPPLSSPPVIGGGGKTSTTGSAFDDLWTTSLSATASAPKPTPAGGVQGKTIKDLEKEKAMDKLWGGGSGSQAQGQGGQFDDLLF